MEQSEQHRHHERTTEPLQLLAPGGDLAAPEQWPADLARHLEVGADSAELVRDLYRWMRLTRRLDSEAFALQRHGELGLWAPSLGQEAAQVGSVAALRPTDQIFPSYREHAAALFRGVTPAQMLEQWRGVSGCGWDPAELHLSAYSVVLGAHLPHATGYAMGVQRDGSDEVVTAYFGDGASSQGDANEAFNWAAACSAPVLFFCQNNQYAISTPTRLQMRTSVHQRARGFGLDSYLVDGNDVLAVHAVTKLAVEQIRSGAGPALIEAVTYRMGAHTSSDDPTRYRDQAEADAWRSRDPLTRVEKLLQARGWAPPEWLGALEEECEELGVQLRRACQEFGPVELGGLFDHVLAERTAALSAQKAEYADFVASFEGVA
ncbi:pyruvate dehydrogenase E1 component alpha subunit [Kineosporia sp. NBRC 101677]|uniref:thiamine pyrophosphate-dependent enzyme n=1 Tax=Kineosporia sp. NBRC 101677 TaxID=3032197 RepID=UPI0024A5B5FC|nr:thiamine pyrophosphate-dependent enzyme [Kineosporia sp. NBRC 101677]GLY16426.1 pyruvate dehydrogenase E1 component alpha subunit [Kineosporia sp. NBRC 101677]